MRNDQKAKAELLQEVETLRRRVAGLEHTEHHFKQKEESLKKEGGRLHSLLKNMSVTIDAVDSHSSISDQFPIPGWAVGALGDVAERKWRRH
ncbi:unnamed protein product [marine sediment metagenome]|uniref:Uncharacterized protein n=1 Tax=marine sediment metagenome TaxID=412755 RepID=X1EEY1_9ZZZZ